MANVSKKLLDYLWGFPHREYSDIAAGGSREWIFEIPKSEEKRFLDLYYGALINGADGVDGVKLPVESVRGPVEMEDGPYSRQFAGYDFDGFYERGMKCDMKCIRHVKFYRALWYIDDWRGRNMLCYTEPSGDKAGYVVCIMEDNK
jgi:hypothetical protein